MMVQLCVLVNFGTSVVRLGIQLSWHGKMQNILDHMVVDWNFCQQNRWVQLKSVKLTLANDMKIQKYLVHMSGLELHFDHNFPLSLQILH